MVVKFFPPLLLIIVSFAANSAYSKVNFESRLQELERRVSLLESYHRGSQKEARPANFKEKSLDTPDPRKRGLTPEQKEELMRSLEKIKREKIKQKEYLDQLMKE